MQLLLYSIDLRFCTLLHKCVSVYENECQAYQKKKRDAARNRDYDYHQEKPITCRTYYYFFVGEMTIFTIVSFLMFLGILLAGQGK